MMERKRSLIVIKKLLQRVKTLIAINISKTDLSSQKELFEEVVKN